MSTSDLARVKAAIEAEWKAPDGKSGSSQTSAAKKKTIKPKQQKNVLYAAVWHFQSEGPNERGEGNTNSKSTGGNQDKGANNIGKPRLSSKEIASKAMEYESV